MKGPRHLMQLRTRLLRTSTFRLAVAYTLVFAASGFAILAFIYWATTSLMDRGIVEAINAETEELARQYRLGGLPVLVAEVDRRGASYRGRSQLYLITDPRLVGLAGNLSGWPSEEPNAGGWVDFPIREPGVGADGEHSARARLIRLEGGYHLLVGHDMTERNRFGRIMTGAMAVALLITILVGLLGGLLMGRRVLGRLEAVNRTSREILGGALDRRIPLTGRGDEFDQLADNLNAMLERLEKLMTGMRQVTDNVAHDLRSPLSRLRSRLEVTLLGQPDAAAYREALRDTVTEVDGVLATFNALLGIARIEAGTVRAIRHRSISPPSRRTRPSSTSHSRRSGASSSKPTSPPASPSAPTGTSSPRPSPTSWTTPSSTRPRGARWASQPFSAMAGRPSPSPIPGQASPPISARPSSGASCAWRRAATRPAAAWD